MQYSTTGGKLKTCELALHWPEEMTFSATAKNRVMAEKMAAALACMKLKVRMIFLLWDGGGGETTIPFTFMLELC